MVDNSSVNESVLTKDTTTGNPIFKPLPKDDLSIIQDINNVQINSTQSTNPVII
jgi:hypothetical protein